MTAEQRAFIRILRDHIHGRKTDFEDDVPDLKKLVDYAEEQALSGIVYIQLRDFLNKCIGIYADIFDRLHVKFQQEIYLYANRKTELREFGRKCGNIPFVLMKGIVVQTYWPVPELRSMGDIDIIIHHDNREKTDKIMLEAGYRKMVDNHAVWTYEKDYITFEIHDHMFYEYLANQVDYRSYFDRIWNHTSLIKGTENIYIPDENFHFLYLITHLAKHIINKGMGFRAFMDLVFLTQQAGERMNWQWITRELKKIKLFEFTKTCFAFCQRWFHVQMPIASISLDDRFYYETTAKMFSDGIFGLHNVQNEASHSAKEIKRSKHFYWISAFKLTLGRLFPPYRDMQLVPWYSFVNGKPWLMPVAWVYRWIYVITHKFKQGRDLLIEPYSKRKIIKKREKMISSWGL